LAREAGLATADEPLIDTQEIAVVGYDRPEVVVVVRRPNGVPVRFTHWHPLGVGKYPCTARRIELVADALERWQSTIAQPHDKAAVEKPKRSRTNGGVREKCIAALRAWHKYDDGGCMNTEPIGVNELQRRADVGQGTASRFFVSEFGGRGKYVTVCQTPSTLSTLLKGISGEARAREFLRGRDPTGESGRDDDE
jgi:hypothetical protein